jgi:HupE / UreJ protein
MRLAITLAACLSVASHLSAHRLDEYLQATLFSVEKDHVQGSLRLIPGVAVSSLILANIDTNRDGVISETETRTYAESVLHDLSLTVDGTHPTLHLLSVAFPKKDEMREGLGEIHIDFSADVPEGGPDRKLIFENRHQTRIAVYLVNCLVPDDPDIRILRQNRNEQQSFYELDYQQIGKVSAPSRARTFPNAATLRFWFHGFVGMFRLGMRHIAGGTDHLLFLLALLLPAPLMASRSRWTGSTGPRRGVARILKIVTAFTIGHSLTLALAALGMVHPPDRPIEVLIAVSILVSAVHALRPVFPGRESVVAAFFGLIHGLAFAATLDKLGLTPWQRVISLLGFNIGIETMQLIVVAAVLPSLILLGRTPAYAPFRIGGAVFAVLASLCWIAERLLRITTHVDTIVNSVASHAVPIAAALLLISLGFWARSSTAQRRNGGPRLTYREFKMLLR